SRKAQCHLRGIKNARWRSYKAKGHLYPKTKKGIDDRAVGPRVISTNEG
ncbi:2478_t:CDS:1, partial [Dentiscutata heterogama]